MNNTRTAMAKAIQNQATDGEVPEEYTEDMYDFSVDNAPPDQILGAYRKYGITKHDLDVENLRLLYEDYSEGDKQQKDAAVQTMIRAVLVLLNCMRHMSGLSIDSVRDPNQWMPKELEGDRRALSNLGNKMTISKSIEMHGFDEAKHAAPGVFFRLIAYNENIMFILQNGKFFDPEMRDLTAPNKDTQEEFREKQAKKRMASKDHVRGKEILATVNAALGYTQSV